MKRHPRMNTPFYHLISAPAKALGSFPTPAKKSELLQPPSGKSKAIYDTHN